MILSARSAGGGGVGATLLMKKPLPVTTYTFPAASAVGPDGTHIPAPLCVTPLVLVCGAKKEPIPAAGFDNGTPTTQPWYVGLVVSLDGPCGHSARPPHVT